RDMFSAIFFVTIGLLFNPKTLIDYAIPIIVITFVVLIGKILISGLGTFLSGKDAKTSLRVGMGLAQIGEFSFVIASLGIKLNVTGSFLFPIAVSVSVITTFLSPYLIKYSDPIASCIFTMLPNKVLTIFDSYTAWLRNIQLKKTYNGVRKVLYRN